MAAASLVAAVARNGVIGKDNRLRLAPAGGHEALPPPDDGRPGHHGAQDLGLAAGALPPPAGPAQHRAEPQPGWQAAGAEVAPSLAAALAAAGDAPQVFVIGGGQAYAEAMAIADQLVITEIDHDFVGDTYFPPRPATFAETTRETHRAAAPNTFEFSFVTYQRTR
jgi:dihydrofolate reductase